MEPLKVIFLDVDGVLNTPKLVKRFGFDFIDDILVSLVAWIVRQTQAEIVLSSTWRIQDKDRTLVKEALARHDLKLLDCTPELPQRKPEDGNWEGWSGWVRRNEEIRAWLDANTVEKFAILDDMEDARIEGFFFQTDENVGITVQIAEKVIEHLNS